MIVRTKNERRLLQQEIELKREITRDSVRGFKFTLAYLQRFPYVTRKRIANAVNAICG